MKILSEIPLEIDPEDFIWQQVWEFLRIRVGTSFCNFFANLFRIFFSGYFGNYLAFPSAIHLGFPLKILQHFFLIFLAISFGFENSFGNCIANYFSSSFENFKIHYGIF